MFLCRMARRLDWRCHRCSNGSYRSDDDGFSYCVICNAEADDIFEPGIDNEQLVSQYSVKCSRPRKAKANAIPAEPESQVKLTTSPFLDNHDIPDNSNMEDDGLGPTEPTDFGSFQKKNIHLTRVLF